MLNHRRTSDASIQTGGPYLNWLEKGVHVTLMVNG